VLGSRSDLMMDAACASETSINFSLTTHRHIPGEKYSSCQAKVKVKVKVTLQLTVGQSVGLSWCRAPFGAQGQIFLYFLFNKILYLYVENKVVLLIKFINHFVLMTILRPYL
jgi:hypothetical protein